MNVKDIIIADRQRKSGGGNFSLPIHIAYGAL